MLFELLVNSAKKYASSPIQYIYVVLVRAFLCTVTVFSALAVVLLALLALSTFGLMKAYGTVAMAVISLAALAFSAYFWAAYKGAMIKSLLDAERGEAHLKTFLSYAIENGMRFFGILLVETVLLLLVSAPVGAAFYFLKPDISSPLGMGLIAVALILSFVVKFLLSFTYIAAAVGSLASITALQKGVAFVIRNFLAALALFILYVIVEISLLIPVVNVIALATTYPIIKVSMLTFYRAKAK